MTTNGRDEKGRFVAGEWKGGPGRPPREVEEDYLRAFREAVSPSDFLEATKAVLSRAKEGDPRCWALLASYALGRPRMFETGEGDEKPEQYVITITPEANKALVERFQEENL